MNDIKGEILYQLDNLKDLQNLCHTDKQFYRLCSTKSFWIHWYNKNNIKFPDSGFNRAEDWINEYIEISKFNKMTNDMIYNLQYGNKNLIYSTNAILQNILGDDFKDFSDKHYGKTVKIRIYYNKCFIVSYLARNDIIYLNLNKNQLHELIMDLLMDGYQFYKLY